ncbi:hypothetical protein [Sphingomonas sp.]|jgi:hypothetical protein|uniref:hypothetical protein n=1 Tax=Sphingomonas sp. TaxID=28214 RepID=UPI002E33B536|nr:hypothetical protein [Sphingomonas sp.]HEX4695306.1 hypothetical protein [Sphingomonas sp.]
MDMVRTNSVTRRRALRGMAAVTAGSVVLPGIAKALPLEGDVRVLRCRYALRGDRIVEGYFVSPRGTHQIDTMVLLHREAGLDAAALATARRYASAGKLVVLPDLSATYRGSLAGRDAQVADVKRLAGKLAKHARGTGKVEVVSI